MGGLSTTSPDSAHTSDETAEGAWLIQVRTYTHITHISYTHHTHIPHTGTHTQAHGHSPIHTHSMHATQMFRNCASFFKIPFLDRLLIPFPPTPTYPSLPCPPTRSSSTNPPSVRLPHPTPPHYSAITILPFHPLSAGVSGPSGRADLSGPRAQGRPAVRLRRVRTGSVQGNRQHHTSPHISQ